MANINFTNVWPYNAIKPVTVDGQAMIRIPKIYVKNGLLPKSSQYPGRLSYFIAKEKLDDDWHVHPAFVMSGGKEASALDISVYEASHDAVKTEKAASVKTTSYWQEISRDNAISACTKRNIAGGNNEQKGWHCFGIYDYALLARLKLIETGKTSDEATTDIFDLHGSTTGPICDTKTYEIYHGIENPFGNPTAPCLLPGVNNVGNVIGIYKNDGSGKMISTGLKVVSNGWVTDFSTLKGDAFDLGDVFIASATTQNKMDGVASDWQQLLSDCDGETIYFTGYVGPCGHNYRGSEVYLPAGSHGAFSLSMNFVCGQSPSTGGKNSTIAFATTSPNAYHNRAAGPLRFRLAHFVE